MLCSTGQARKTAGLDFHDAERFSDRGPEGTAIADYHPAFHFYATMADPYAVQPDQPEVEPTNAFFALDKVVEFFVDLGWPPNSARLGMEYIAARLSRCGKPEIAYGSLLREGDGPGFLDIGQHAWIDVLRAVLGDAHPDFAGTTRSRDCSSKPPWASPSPNSSTTKDSSTWWRPRHLASPTSQVRPMSERGHVELDRSITHRRRRTPPPRSSGTSRHSWTR